MTQSTGNEVKVEDDKSTSPTANTVNEESTQSKKAEEQQLTELEQKVKEEWENLHQQLVRTDLQHNSMLSYKTAASRGISLRDETPDGVFERLVTQGKTLQFAPEPDPPAPPIAEGVPQVEAREPRDLPKQSKSRLQTKHEANELNTRLRNTAQRANQKLRNEGVHELHVTYGYMEWKDPEGKTHRSPILNDEAEIIREGKRAEPKLKRSGSDIEINRALQEKLKQDWGVELPPIPTDGKLKPSEYLKACADAVSNIADISVDEDSVAVDNLSFGQFFYYKFLDHERWPEGRKPWQNPNVIKFLGDGFTPNPPVVEPGKNIDDYSDDVAEVCDLDSSQMNVALEAMRGEPTHTEGPPGAGKSQLVTATNAERVRRGKTCLTGALKLAALEAPYEMFSRIGLNAIALLLHPEATSKKQLLDELNKTWKSGAPLMTETADLAPQRRVIREQLNDHRDRMGREISDSGYSIFDLLGELNESKIANIANIEVAPEVTADLNKDNIGGAIEASEQLSEFVAKNGLPKENPFYGAKVENTNLGFSDRFKKSAKTAQTSNAKVKAKAKAISDKLGCDEETELTLSSITRLVSALKYLRENEEVHKSSSGVDLNQETWSQEGIDYGDLHDVGTEYKRITEEQAAKLNADAWGKDSATLTEWKESLQNNQSRWQRFWPWSKLKYTRHHCKELFADPKNKITDDERISTIKAILQRQDLEKSIGTHGKTWATPFGDKLWQGAKSDWDTLDNVEDLVVEFQKEYGDIEQQELLHAAFANAEAVASLDNEIAELESALASYVTDFENTLDQLEFDSSVRDIKAESLTAQEKTLGSWQSEYDKLEAQRSYNAVSEKVHKSSIGAVLEQLDEWPADQYDRIGNSIQVAWLNSLLEKAVEEMPDLRGFSRQMHENLIEEYVKLEARIQQQNIEKVAKVHFDKLPAASASHGNTAKLRRHIDTDGRSSTTREIMNECMEPILALKPNWIASIDYLARNIDPANPPYFDYGTLDEGSQATPQAALVIMMLCKSFEYYLDDKQLPPPSFFKGAAENTYRNIGEMGLAKGITQNSLQWHFRSRYPDLIAFQNDRYYDGKLVIFPSPHRDAREVDRGLHFKQTGLNDLVPQVVEFIVEHAKTRPDLDLGVVLPNENLREQVEREVEKRCESVPELRQFIDSRDGQVDEFFVLATESVQGDERRAMLSTIASYPTEKHPDRFTNNFGFLNNEGGEKRFNTASTRSREYHMFMTNFAPEQMDANPKHAGPKDVRDFMYWARDRQMNRQSENKATQKPETKAIHKQIMSALAEKGLKTEANYGESGCYISIAIKHPDDDNQIILGVMLDDENYTRFESARDRDRLIPQVLKAGGWALHNVWTLDFYERPEAIVNEIVEKVEHLKQNPATKTEPKSAHLERQEFVQREWQGNRAIPPFDIGRVLRVGVDTDIEKLSDGDLAQAIEDVMLTARCVHKNDLTNILIDSFSNESTRSAKSKVEAALEKIAKSDEYVFQEDFVMLREYTRNPTVRNRKAYEFGNRKLFDVDPVDRIAKIEIEAAIFDVTEKACGIELDDLATGVRVALGLVRHDTEERIKNVIAALEAEGALSVDEWGRVQINQEYHA